MKPDILPFRQEYYAKIKDGITAISHDIGFRNCIESAQSSCISLCTSGMILTMDCERELQEQPRFAISTQYTMNAPLTFLRNKAQTLSRHFTQR